MGVLGMRFGDHKRIEKNEAVGQHGFTATIQKITISSVMGSTKHTVANRMTLLLSSWFIGLKWRLI